MAALLSVGRAGVQQHLVMFVLHIKMAREGFVPRTIETQGYRRSTQPLLVFNRKFSGAFGIGGAVVGGSSRRCGHTCL